VVVVGKAALYQEAGVVTLAMVPFETEASISALSRSCKQPRREHSEDVGRNVRRAFRDHASSHTENVARTLEGL
jgi:hypothetical protein